MKPLLLSLFLIFFNNLSSSELFSVYEQLVVVNKYWASQEAPVSLKESHSQLSHTQLIQTHLILVEKTLRRKSTTHLTLKQRQKRTESLTNLKAYALKGKFPINLYHNKNTPYFIDNFGTACAVGQLIIESNHKQLALCVKAVNNFAYIENMDFPRLNNWAKQHGFTKDELMWI